MHIHKDKQNKEWLNTYMNRWTMKKQKITKPISKFISLWTLCKYMCIYIYVYMSISKDLCIFKSVNYISIHTIHSYIYSWIFIYLYIYISIYLDISRSIYWYIDILIYWYIDTFIYWYNHIFIYFYFCIFTHTNIYIYMYIYICIWVGRYVCISVPTSELAFGENQRWVSHWKSTQTLLQDKNKHQRTRSPHMWILRVVLRKKVTTWEAGSRWSSNLEEVRG